MGVSVYAEASIVNQKTMSNIKSLSLTLQNAVKVEVVSSCVWTHTAPYANINTYEGEMKFSTAAIAVAKQSTEHIFTTIFVTTKEAGDWMHRFDITKHELARLAAYEFVKLMPTLLAKAYGVHADGYIRLRTDSQRDATRKMSEAFELDFNREVESSISEFRNDSCSKNDPVVEESSTVADYNQFDAIKYIDNTKQNS